MRTSYCLSFLIGLFAYAVMQAQSPQPEIKHKKRFALRNTYYKVDYSANEGATGADGEIRWVIQIFRSSKRGGVGKTGHHGPDLQVNVSAFSYQDTTLLLIAITKKGRKKVNRYYLNPLRGKIVIYANGGDGGRGGKGEDATDTRPYAGDGGNGGRGGDAGTIRVIYEPSAIPYLNYPCLIYSTSAGRGGHGGDGGKAMGANSQEGSPGGEGDPGQSNPQIVIEDIHGTTLQISPSL